MSAEQIRAMHDAVLKNAAADGKVIAAGFAAYVAVIRPETQQALDDARTAYMAGAQHLFSSILSILDPDSEPTPADLQRMSLIANELDAWTKEMALRLAPAGGAA